MSDNSNPKQKPDTTSSDELVKYRDMLVEADRKSLEDFDKTVLSLSGGALGISFVFLKDIIGPEHMLRPTFLLVAWTAWGLSTITVLTSFYLSHCALRKAISQVDKRTIRNEKPGGVCSLWTRMLTAAGAMFFFVGVISIVVFASVNLKNKGGTHDRKETATTSSAPKTTTDN